MRRDRARRGFPALIYERRRELKLTQEQVAKRIGVHANYIGYLEKGERRPSNATLTRLCRLLRLDRRKVMLSLRPQFRDIVVGPHEAPGGGPLPAELEELRRDATLRRRLRITDEEVRDLALLETFGHVRDKDSYVRFLEVVREVTAP